MLLLLQNYYKEKILCKIMQKNKHIQQYPIL